MEVFILKFIFPKNYNFSHKLFGFIDYSTAVFNLVWYIFIFCLINIFFSNLNIKIFLFILFCFPLSILSFIGFNNENILYVLLYILKFIKSKKIYFYM